MIKRKHLLEKVKGKRIVIADAGAGYGKTVFLNQIAQQKDRKLWITLREEDASQKIFSQKLTKILSGYFEKDFENLTEALNFLCKARPSLSFFIDDIHNLSQESSSLLRYFINYSPDSCEFFLAGRGIRKLLGDIVIKEETLILTEKDLSLKLKEVEKLLEINDLEIDFAKRIYDVTKGFPVAVSLIINLLCEKFDFDKVLKEFEEKHLLPFFEFALEKLEPSLKEKLILLSFLPSRIFRKYFSRSDLEKMRKAGLPLTYTEEKPEPHNLLINFIRKNYEDFFKNKRDFYRALAEKESSLNKILILLKIGDYEKAEKLVKKMGLKDLKEFCHLSGFDFPDSPLNLFKRIYDYPFLYALLSANILFNLFKYEDFKMESFLLSIKNYLEKNLNVYGKDMDFVCFLILRLHYLLRDFHGTEKILNFVESNFSDECPLFPEFLKFRALYHFYVKNDTKKAEEYITKACFFAEKRNDPEILLEIYHKYLQLMHFFKSSYEGTKTIIERGIRIANAIDNKKMLAIFYTELSKYYTWCGMFEKVLSCGEKILQLGEILQDESIKAIGYGCLFTAYWGIGKFDKAKKALENESKLRLIQTNIQSRAIYYYNMGRLFAQIGKTKSAKYYLEKAKDIFKSLNYNDFYYLCLLYISEIYRREGKLSEALTIKKKIAEFLKHKKNFPTYLTVLFTLAYIDKSNRNKILWEAFELIEKKNLKIYLYFHHFTNPREVIIYLLKYAKEKGIKKNVVEDILKDLPYWNELHVLGKAVLYREGEPVEIKSKRLIELLCFFLCNYGKWISRDSILDEVYFHYGRKDIKKLQGKLRKDLHDLRKIIDPDKKFLQYDPYTGSYKLDFGEDFKVDVIEFKKLAEKGLQYGDEDLLQEAIKLWKGEPFEEYEYLIDFLYFLTWKENLKKLFLKVLYKLCEINFDKGLYEEVLSLCERGSIYEPEDEILQKWRIKALRAQNNFIAANKAQEEFEKLKRKFL